MGGILALHFHVRQALYFLYKQIYGRGGSKFRGKRKLFCLRTERGVCLGFFMIVLRAQSLRQKENT